MAVKSFPAVKDTVRAKESDHAQAKDGGGERHLLAGAYSGFIYTSYVKFDPNWTNVKKITKAVLVLTTERNVHTGFPHADSGIKVFKLKTNFPDPNNAAPEGEFAGRYPVESKDATHAANGTCGSGDGQINRIDVTALVGDFAPRSVKRSNGNPGGNEDHHGFAIERRTTSKQDNPRMCVGGMKHADTNMRPYIELTYEPTKSENTVSTVGPSGNINEIEGTSFEGTFNVGANQPSDIAPASYGIELFKQGGTTPVWSYAGAASPSDVLNSTFTVPLSLVGTTGSRYKFVSGQGYEWRVRAKDNKGIWTEWSGKRAFGVLTNPPVLSNPRPSTGTDLETLNNVFFRADFSDPDGNPLLSYEVQVRTLTSPTDPAWGDDLLWDSGPVHGSGFATQTPGASTEIKQPYEGQGLEPGDYSWRMRAKDILEADSAWVYADFTLTKGWEPDPGEVDLLTGYVTRRLKARILIKGMKNHVQTLVKVGSPDSGTFKLTYEGQTTAAIQHDASAADVRTALEALSTIAVGEVAVTKDGSKWVVTFDENGRNRPMLSAGNYNNFDTGERVDVYSNRAPGRPVAVIEDAANIGASEMYNDGGEFFFSLPAIHPQVAVIEPYQVHYALETFRGESWKEIAAGLITDFDATDSDVVFYGQDYMAILARQVDERFNPKKAADAEAVLWPDTGGGAKYVDRTIAEIIKDQLDRSIHDTGSPLAFFTRAALPAMTDNVSIFVAFKQRLPFIAGLIESYRRGEGKRTRIYARRKGEGQYEWVVKDAPGRDRPNIRLEYGGLVQGFRVVPFGDFSTRLNAIGRLYNKSTLEYFVAHAPIPAGEDDSYYEETYGRFAKAVSYEDISDVSDLKRRAKQAAKRMTRVGKALALNLRPGSFQIKDGWDITDSVFVDIKRGVVETTRMGSGYWTIWGWTWELKPNGQELITLSVLPKEDSSAPDIDLIPSEPILSTKGEWQIEARDPDDELDIDVFTHVNSNTGHIFQRDPSTGVWVDRTTELPFFPAVLIDQSLTPERFPPDYKAVWVGASLPSLPDPLYPPGSLATDPATGALMQVSGDGLTWVPFAGSEGVPGPAGPQGPPGAPGSVWWQGSGAPTSGTGVVGDYYLDTTNGNVYQKTGTTTWTLTGNIKGPTGSTGSPGTPGAPGVPGSVWHQGSGVPAGALGVVGDYYLNTLTGDVYQKTGASTWTLIANIKGPTGAPGPQGPAGPASGAIMSAFWLYHTTTAAPPASGQIRTTASLNPTGTIWLHHTDAAGLSWAGVHPAVGDYIVLRNTTGETLSLRVTAYVDTVPGAGGYGTITVAYDSGAGTIKKNENIHVSLIRKQTAGDGADPPTVFGLTVTPSYQQQPDGTDQPALFVTWTPLAAVSDLIGYELQWDEGSYSGVGVYTPADWVNARTLRVGKDIAYASLPIIGGVTYDVRLRAYDNESRLGPWSTVTEKLAPRDNSAPQIPDSVEVAPGFKSLGVTWTPNTEPDISQYGVRYRPVGSVEWSSVWRTKSSRIIIDNLTPDVLHEVQVRAIDRSGNVQTSAVDATAVVAEAFPEAGWSVAVTGTPNLIAPADLAVDTVVANFITSGVLSADSIVGGALKVGGAGQTSELRIYNDAGQPIGAWGDFGWIVADPENPSRAIWAAPTGELKFSDTYDWDATDPIEAGIASPSTVWGTAIGPDGINAEAITFGPLFGGDNRIRNAGMELITPAAVVPQSYTWTATTDWDDATSQVNLNVSGADLKMTAI